AVARQAAGLPEHGGTDRDRAFHRVGLDDRRSTAGPRPMTGRDARGAPWRPSGPPRYTRERSCLHPSWRGRGIARGAAFPVLLVFSFFCPFLIAQDSIPDYSMWS